MATSWRFRVLRCCMHAEVFFCIDAVHVVRICAAFRWCTSAAEHRGVTEPLSHGTTQERPNQDPHRQLRTCGLRCWLWLCDECCLWLCGRHRLWLCDRHCLWLWLCDGRRLWLWLCDGRRLWLRLCNGLTWCVAPGQACHVAQKQA